jgi:hypothetical protein
MPPDLLYWHNEGEKDYAEDNGFNPPHGELVLAGLDPSISSEDAIEENRAYKQGWKNAEEQAS